eukprot:GEMP01007130.1.p1 GENE.GEMP01007130.1~~GEMP01007130.1.p1  ORF type:complete len:468 (+),score=64.76 GEMP01007130.1:1978-3381(+)
MAKSSVYYDAGDQDLGLLRLLSLVIFYVPYGMVYCLLGLFVFPAEAVRLYPNETSTGLTVMLAVCGVAQLLSPLFGKISDESRFALGRRRPFIIVGSIMGALGFGIMWHASIALNGFLYLTGLLLSQTSLTIVCCAQQGLLPDFIPEDKQGQASGWVAICMLTGSVSGFLWVLFHYTVNIQIMYPIFSAMIIITMIITCIGAVEVPGTMPLRRQGRIQMRPRSLLPIIRLPALSYKEIKSCYTMDFAGMQYHDFNWVFASRMFYHMAISIQTFMIFFLRDIVNISSYAEQNRQMAIISLIGQLCGALMAYPMGKLSDRTGRKILIYIACAVLAVAYLGIAFSSTFENPLPGIYFCAVIYGLGNGCFLAVDTALALDVLPDPTEAAKAFGIWGVSGFVGLTLGPACWGSCLEFFGKTVEGHYKPGGYYAFLIGGAVVVFLSSLAVKQVRAVHSGGAEHSEHEVRRLVS